mmetsp:Transcript_34277/g.89470  ORF Transcript_34277/g.89470 Transcript_34277/m.89470 type:complete len:321 (+) Transcript_34277:52-1014(+)
MAHLSPCQQVRRTAAEIASSAQHVSIQEDQMAAIIPHLNPDTTVAWRDCPFHFVEEKPGELTVLYVLVVDAINFCFWPSSTEFEYDTLGNGIKAVAQEEPSKLSPAKLSTVSADELSAWFPGSHLPEAEERARLLRELGTVLATHFEGSAMKLVEAAGQSVARLVDLLVCRLPGFRDEGIYAGRQVFFYKRAQICAADLWGAFQDGGQCLDPRLDFKDVDQLTIFPDYRLPQLLRHFGVLKYSETLSELVDAQEELPAGGAMEFEIRACTIHCCSRLRAMLSDHYGKTLIDVHVDWALWQKGEAEKDTIKPHHRTRTMFY